MTEEDNLSEEGLGKVIKKQDKKLKEDLDEINYRNKELERRQKEQQQDIPGLFEARSGLRTGTGLAFEILANTGLDAFSFVPGSQQVGSAFINYLAQKIRGGEVSKGEILAAAATSQIPGLAQARALTRGGRFARSVAKGGISGGVTTTSMSLVDEKELPSFGEFATGVTGGGLLGGAFDLAPAALTGNLSNEIEDIKFDSSVFLKQLKARVTGGHGPVHPSLYPSGIFNESGTIAAARNPSRRQVRVAIDGKQSELFDVRDYTEYATIGDELIARSEGVVPDPTAPNYRQLQTINQQVFKNIQNRIAVEKGINPEDAFYSVVAQNPNFSFVEHLTAKGGYMDWYWQLSGQNKHASDNVRLLLNDPFKQLKDVVENFGYGTAANNYSGPFLRNTNLSKRLVVDVEMPKQLLSKQGIPAIAQNEPGNIIIREAGKKVNGKFKKGRVVGKFGDYLDVLFRNESEIIEGLLEQARQGRPALLKATDRYGRRLAVTSSELRGPEGRATRKQLSNQVVRARFKQWRKELIEERIQEILEKRGSKLKLSKAKAEQRINARILEDMEQLRNDYPFLGGRARAVEQTMIDADPELATSALLTDRPKSSKIARDADIRTKTTLGASSLSGANNVKIKVKFNNGKTGEIIRRTDRNGNITYHRIGKGKIQDREIFSSEFTAITPSKIQQSTLPLDE